MVYFIFEALYCRFFFFFHFNEALIALHLEITFVLLSLSFSPLLLLKIRFFFLSPVIVTPKRYYLLFLRSTDYFSFLFAFDFFSSIVSGMDATIPVSFISVVRNSALHFSRIFFLPFLFSFSSTRLSYSTSPTRLLRPREIDIPVQTWTREPMNF